MLQLDIFGDSQEVQLRNGAVLALQRRVPAAACRARAALTAGSPADPLPPELARRAMC
jgi:hypothetical protein